MDEQDNSVKGWAFPPKFNAYSKSVEMVSGKQSINESLQVLLTTIPGERLMELDYGCDLTILAFKNLDLNLKTFITNNIKAAIDRWEKRISVQSVDIGQINDIDDTIKVTIVYTILQTLEVENFTFDYTFA